MDPITHASTLFLAEAEAFWRSSQGRMLPMIAEPSDRGELVKTLRLREFAPDNRWPLFLYEDPFVDPARYFGGLAEAIARDYERVRGDAREEGVVLSPFVVRGQRGDDRRPPIERAVWAVERAAALLNEHLDGALVALVPSSIADASAWRESIDILHRVRFSKHARVAIHHRPERPLSGVLGDLGTRLRLDPEELLAYLRLAGIDTCAGPPVAMPSHLTQEQQGALEAASDRRPSPGVSVKVRALMLEAAEQTAAGRSHAAAARYREARSLCAAERLGVGEAMVLMALGGACFGAVASQLGLESYGRAAELAQAEEAWPVVCQAWLGIGGVHLARKHYAPAAQAYRRAADAAAQGEVAVLRIEALRLAGTCLLLGGADEDALVTWKQAVDAGAALAEPVRSASTLGEVSTALTELLKRLGLDQQAAHVEALQHGRQRAVFAETVREELQE